MNGWAASDAMEGGDGMSCYGGVWSPQCHGPWMLALLLLDTEPGFLLMRGQLCGFISQVSIQSCVSSTVLDAVRSAQKPRVRGPFLNFEVQV